MPCEVIRFEGGGAAIVCSSTKRCACGNRAVRECDWKVETRRSGTCDKALCLACTTVPAEGKDLCKRHAEDWKAWLKEKRA